MRVFTADCAPVLLADGRKRALALVHAGWRGAANGILGRAVKLLERKAGVGPKDLWMVVGPCIHQCCYEVGGDVARCFPRNTTGGPDKFFLDLPGALAEQAKVLGVSPRKIFLAPHCTVCDRRFFSFRREKTESRQAAVAAFRQL